jgi:putative oxidoreductase
METAMDTPMQTGPVRRIREIYDRLGLLPLSVIQLMARLSLAVVFFRSGLSKTASWDSTVALFAEEYRVPVLPPEIAATLAATVELSMPVFLVLGLFSRLAVLPLIGMIAVIQTFVYPMAWPDHLIWTTLILIVLTRGPGVFSLDHLATRVLFRH